jgi:hypothetical protein
MKVVLEKLSSTLLEEVNYTLSNGSETILLNDLIGKTISLNFTGIIFCSKCQVITKQSFGQGFCFSCFNTAPEASPCIIHPELCQAHLGIGRDLEYEERHHNQTHYVYLAATDRVKVGITRTTQIPTRWIDQGANAALIIAETPNRYTAGVIEVALKDFFVDKTNWQSMLKNIGNESINLVEEKWMAHEQLPSDLAQYFTEDEEILSLKYPVKNYPEQVQSMTFDKTAEISGELTGIRGQYLYLNGNQVLNIRRHTGYEIEFNY